MDKVAGPSNQSPARSICTDILADKETSPLEISHSKNLMKDDNNNTGDSLITKQVERNEDKVLVKVKSRAIVKLCSSCVHENQDITLKIGGKSDGKRKPAKKDDTIEFSLDTTDNSQGNDNKVTRRKKPAKNDQSLKDEDKSHDIHNDTTLKVNNISNNATDQIYNNTENQSDTSKSVKKRGTATTKKAKNEDISQKQTGTKVKKPKTSVKNLAQKKKTTLKKLNVSHEPSTAEGHSGNNSVDDALLRDVGTHSTSLEDNLNINLPEQKHETTKTKQKRGVRNKNLNDVNLKSEQVSHCYAEKSNLFKKALNSSSKNFRNQEKMHVSTDDSMKKEKTSSKQKMNKKCKKENRQRKTDLKVAKALIKMSQYFSNPAENIVGCHMSSSSSGSSSSGECICGLSSSDSSECNCWECVQTSDDDCSTSSSSENSSDDSCECSEGHLKRKSCRKYDLRNRSALRK